MAHYQISSKAKEDIDNIWFYTYENWSIEQANKKFNEIIDQIEFLAKNQRAGKSYHYIKSEIRGFLIKPHMIFYRINSSTEITIERILHESMDLGEQL